MTSTDLIYKERCLELYAPAAPINNMSLTDQFIP